MGTIAVKMQEQSSSEGICAFTSCKPAADLREPAHTFLCAQESPQWQDATWPYCQVRTGWALAGFVSFGRAVVPAVVQRSPGVGGGGTALLLPICRCPPAWTPLSARAEVPLTEEQKGDPGEGVFLIHLLPGPLLQVHWVLDAESSRKLSVGINACMI